MRGVSPAHHDPLSTLPLSPFPLPEDARPHGPKSSEREAAVPYVGTCAESSVLFVFFKKQKVTQPQWLLVNPP